MKLVLAIVSNDDASAVTSALTKNNFYMTRLSTTGGFLRAGNTTLIVGTDDDLVDKCIDVIDPLELRFPSSDRSCVVFSQAPA